MPSRVVDLADCQFSDNPREFLVAFSLGCCVGLSIFDPTAKAGGLMVFMLPDSDEVETLNPNHHPCLFADTAVAHFLKTAMEKGIRPERSKLILAGGGRFSSEGKAFNLGDRNGRAAVRALSQFGLDPTHQSLGGGMNRSMVLFLKTGQTQISVFGEELETV